MNHKTNIIKLKWKEMVMKLCSFRFKVYNVILPACYKCLKKFFDDTAIVKYEIRNYVKHSWW